MNAADSPTVVNKDLRSRLNEQLAQKQAAESADLRLEPPPSSRIGTVLGDRYRVNELLGVGGMGTVYLAKDLELDDDVALKLLRRDVIDVPGAVDRFRREVKLARRVTHPNVSRTYDIASHGDDLFITMEPISGNTLSRVAKGPQLDDRAIAQIGVQICAGLNAAHRAGVVHRDLKPQNVMLESHESDPQRVVIMDFGIAQSSQLRSEGESALGQVVGTPAYMAPEQLSGLTVDQRADLCSLGIVLFELFTGTLPWRGDTPSSTALARLRQDAPDPRDFRKDLPDTLAEVTLHCLSRSPDARPSSAASVALELKAWLRTTESNHSRPLIWLPPSQGDAAATLTSHGLSEINAALEPHPARLATPVTPPSPPSTTPASKPASSRPSSSHPSSRPGSSQPSERPSVAVVPFQHEATVEESCGLLSELCEEVVDQLSRAPGLRVRSLGRVLTLQRANPGWDSERVGQALEVDFVVEASAAPLAGECVLRTRILDVTRDVQLWADRVRTNRPKALEACEQAAKAAVSALTQSTLEDPAFHTWLDLESETRPDERTTTPDAEDGGQISEALPRGNVADTDPEASEHGSPSESGTRKPGMLCASA
ncbi:MAG: serine/threonine-protein kinase [Polyangiaceae bacterium]